MVAEFGPRVEWKDSATVDRNNMGDQIDLPIHFCEGVESLEEMVVAWCQHIQQVKLETDEEELQHRILQRRIQPVDRLDIVIEDISRLMLEASEKKTRIREMMIRGESVVSGQQQ